MSEQCGCCIVYTPEGSEIHYCPKHNAAEDMHAFIKMVLDQYYLPDEALDRGLTILQDTKPSKPMIEKLNPDKPIVDPRDENTFPIPSEIIQWHLPKTLINKINELIDAVNRLKQGWVTLEEVWNNYESLKDQLSKLKKEEA